MRLRALLSTSPGSTWSHESPYRTRKSPDEPKPVPAGMSAVAAAVAKDGGLLLIKAATSLWVIGGLAVFGISALAWLTTLSSVPLSVAYPFNAPGRYS